MIREYDQIPTGTTPSFERKVFRNATFTSYFGFLTYLTDLLINAFDKRAKYWPTTENPTAWSQFESCITDDNPIACFLPAAKLQRP